MKRRVIESIDLTVNDDEEDDYEPMHEQEDNEVQLFKINTTIVGKRYYSGSINQGEEVILVRYILNLDITIVTYLIPILESLRIHMIVMQ